jgi:hypothetical protein
MTPQERASLAEQLLSNPMFGTLFNDVEAKAVEAMIYAADDETRASAAMRVQAIRTLRSDCEASLRSTRERKAAPA